MKSVFLALIVFVFTATIAPIAKAQVFNCSFEGACTIVNTCGTGYLPEGVDCAAYTDPNVCNSQINLPCTELFGYGANGEPCRANNVCNTGNTCVAPAQICTDGNIGSFCLEDVNCDSGWCGPGGRCATFPGDPDPDPDPGTPAGGTAGQLKGDCPNNHMSTAIGCIPLTDVEGMTTFFLRLAIGIAGGIALLLIGFAAFRITTSQGDPRRLQGGQELLLSAIGGLIMVVLSVYLLRFIGVDLLGLF